MATQFTKVAEFNGYAYWIGKSEKNEPVYNIAPIGQSVSGGYYSKEYILKIKKLPDLFN